VFIVLIGVGFPPADPPVREFFIEDKVYNQNHAFLRSCSFLASLFEVAHRWVKFQLGKDVALEEIPKRFHYAMNEGMQFDGHGQFRRLFFQEVVGQAHAVGLFHPVKSRLV
jgi:hypothetical protein